MKFNSYKRFHLIVIITLLLVSQSGLLVHATEHPFHQEDESCEIFISLEQSYDALFDNIAIPSSNLFFSAINYFNSFSLHFFQNDYLIRAPPYQTAS